MHHIHLGDEVKDTVTGFKGIATGLTDFLNGCRRICIQPPIDKAGKAQEANWFDEPQVTVVKAGKVAAGPRNTGGPMISIPTRPEGPRR